jgi:hypothetical protein
LGTSFDSFSVLRIRGIFDHCGCGRSSGEDGFGENGGMPGPDQFSQNFWENAVAGLFWDLADWIPKLPVTRKIV